MANLRVGDEEEEEEEGEKNGATQSQWVTYRLEKVFTQFVELN